jgi:predicted NBD/HSP70 family sugar kinase
MTREIWAAVGKGQKTTVTETLTEPNGQIRSSELQAAYVAGDRLVRRVVDQAAQYLGIGLGAVANLLNPGRIILGGGVVEAFGQEYVDRVRTLMEARCFKDVFATSELVSAKLGDDAGIIGAGLLACRALDAAHKKKIKDGKAKAAKTIKPAKAAKPVKKKPAAAPGKATPPRV